MLQYKHLSSTLQNSEVVENTYKHWPMVAVTDTKHYFREVLPNSGCGDPLPCMFQWYKAFRAPGV